LSYLASPPRDETCAPPNLLDPGETLDALSLSLHRFARRPSVQSCIVSAILGQEFFDGVGNTLDQSDGPGQAGIDDHDDHDDKDDTDHEDSDDGMDESSKGSDVESNDTEVDDDANAYSHDDEDGSDYHDNRPYSALTDMRLSWPKVTPDGRWLYERAKGGRADDLAWSEYDSDSTPDSQRTALQDFVPDAILDDPAYTRKHRFRDKPVKEVLSPLLKSMARAMAKMPALQTFYWEDDTDWPNHRVEYNPELEDGGGELEFRGFGSYTDGDVLIDTHPLVDEDVVDYFKEVLSAREPRGDVRVLIE